MAYVIDYNRGCDIRRHAATGMTIFSYNDEPGVFRNAHGIQVGEQLAAESGFDTERLGREKKRRAAAGAALAAIDAEFNSGAGGQHEVVLEREGFTVVHLGAERYNLEDPDGNIMNAAGPLSKTLALKVFDQAVPPAKPAVEEKAPKLSLGSKS